jgi:hypothetical protein
MAVWLPKLRSYVSDTMAAFLRDVRPDYFEEDPSPAAGASVPATDPASCPRASPALPAREGGDGSDVNVELSLPPKGTP